MANSGEAFGIIEMLAVLEVKASSHDILCIYASGVVKIMKSWMQQAFIDRRCISNCLPRVFWGSAPVQRLSPGLDRYFSTS